jgi:hypothetical protein
MIFNAFHYWRKKNPVILPLLTPSKLAEKGVNTPLMGTENKKPLYLLSILIKFA